DPSPHHAPAPSPLSTLSLHDALPISFLITSTPVSREPVRVITGTSGWRTSRSPTAPPPPCTMLITPFGRPESSNNSTNRSPSKRSEEHTSELQSRSDLVCRLLLEKKK